MTLERQCERCHVTRESGRPCALEASLEFRHPLAHAVLGRVVGSEAARRMVRVEHDRSLRSNGPLVRTIRVVYGLAIRHEARCIGGGHAFPDALERVPIEAVAIEVLVVRKIPVECEPAARFTHVLSPKDCERALFRIGENEAESLEELRHGGRGSDRRPLLLAHRFVAFQMASFKAQYASWKSRPEPE